MVAYIDSSVLLRILLQQPNRCNEIANFSNLYALELIETECLRVFHRLRLQGQLDDAAFSEKTEAMHEFLLGMHIIPMTQSILKQAGNAFSTVLGTLDALHLSAAIQLFEKIPVPPKTLLSHDIQMARAAKSLGMEVFGV